MESETLERERLTARRVLDGAATQLRVVHALILRETKTRYGEHKMGFLWAFVEPLALVAIMAVVFSGMRSDSPGGMPLVPFMITGFVPFMIFRDTMGQMIGAISQNRSLLAFPQVTTFDVVLARGLLEIAVLLVVLAVLLGLASVFGFEVRVESPLKVLGACLTLALMGAGAGFLFASLSPVVPAVRQFVTAFLGRPLFFGSGLFYTADTLPATVREWLLYNPLLHLIELVRSACFHEFESAHASWDYALTWAVLTLALGLLVHQALSRRAVVGL